MAIILEGPDAAGKTTLGRFLANNFGMRLVTSGGAPKTYEEVLEFCKSQAEACNDRRAVIDRVTCISHPIYNPAYRTNLLLMDQLRQLVRHPMVIVVYCRPPVSDLMRPEKHAWKDYDTEEHKQNILNHQMKFIDLYDRAFQFIPHLPYDYTTTHEEGTAHLVSMLAATQVNDEMVKKLNRLVRVRNQFCAR